MRIPFTKEAAGGRDCRPRHGVAARRGPLALLENPLRAATPWLRGNSPPSRAGEIRIQQRHDTIVLSGSDEAPDWPMLPVAPVV